MSAPGKRERRAARRAGDPDGRLEFFDRARAYTPYLGVSNDVGRFVVSTNSQKIGKHLFTKQDRPEFRVLPRAAAVIEELLGGTGSLFIDIGANIGTSTVAALRLPMFDSAVCCEPETENFRMLGANLALNDLDDVRRLQVAVSARPERAQLLVVGGPPGKTAVYIDPQDLRDKQARVEQRLAGDPSLDLPVQVTDIELVTLDGLIEQGAIDPEQAGLLWLDVEGHEGHVLAGAQTLTERGVPIVFEFDPTALELSGDRQAIHDVAERFYTHFTDLRRSNRERRGLHLRPVAELPELAERWLDPRLEGRFSDLLLLRLDERQARLGEGLSRRSSGRD